MHDIVEHSELAGDIVQGPNAGPAMSALRDFMFEHVYLGPAVRAEHAKIANIIERLFEHYVEHPELLPPVAPGASANGASGGEADREGALATRVTDYLAGMTDRFCIRQYLALAGDASEEFSRFSERIA